MFGDEFFVINVKTHVLPPPAPSEGGYWEQSLRKWWGENRPTEEGRVAHVFGKGRVAHEIKWVEC